MIRAARLGVVAALVVATLSAVVQPAGAESQTFFNTTPITFSGTSEGGGASYSSNIQVSGLEGMITDVDLHVNAIDMDDLHDLQLLLVAPSGEAEIAKTYHCQDQPVSTMQLTFDQQAADVLPVENCGDGASYRPYSQCATSPCSYFDGFPGARSANFDNFIGENANGIWRLYAYRTCYGAPCQATGDRIAAGWSLSLDTGGYAVDLPAGGGTHGPASPYPMNLTLPLETDLGLITDLDVQLGGIFHTHPDDIEIMLEKVGGPRVMLMSDACGSYDLNGASFLWSDEAPAPMADDGTTTICGNPNVRPTDHAPGDSLPSPAPAGPYSATLGAFDLVDPRGEWRMWIADDATGDEGFVTTHFSLDLATRPRAAASWLIPTGSVAEGDTGTLKLVRGSGGPYASGTVTVTSAAGTAGAADFGPVSETVVFAAGEASKTVQVTVPDDGIAEAAETFTLSLSGATGDAQIGSPETITVTIPAGRADTRAPETSILKAPKPRTSTSRAKVKFEADEAGARFTCRLDKRKWKPCTSPTKLRGLAPGRHTFRVRAADAAGNVEAKAAVVRWRVLR